jgi:tetratricopeptide (TPR) repeat protein
MKHVFIFSLLIFFLYSCESSKIKIKKNIVQLENLILADSIVAPDEDSLVLKLVDNYKAFAKESATDSLAPEYLFKGAKMYASIYKYQQAIELFAEVNLKFNQSKLAPYALFMQAFTYENNMNNLEKAKLIYTSFIEKYPTHTLKKDAESSLMYLGKSPEELIKIFQEKAKLDSMQGVKVNV